MSVVSPVTQFTAKGRGTGIYQYLSLTEEFSRLGSGAAWSTGTSIVNNKKEGSLRG